MILHGHLFKFMKINGDDHVGYSLMRQKPNDEKII